VRFWLLHRANLKGRSAPLRNWAAGCKVLPQFSGPFGFCNEAGFKKTGISFTWRTCEKSYQNVSRAIGEGDPCLEKRYRRHLSRSVGEPEGAGEGRGRGLDLDRVLPSDLRPSSSF
jgi:hypothetical protein